MFYDATLSHSLDDSYFYFYLNSLDRFDLLLYVFWKPSEATIFAIYRSLEPLFIAGRIPYGVMRVIFLEVPMLSLL